VQKLWKESGAYVCILDMQYKTAPIEVGVTYCARESDFEETGQFVYQLIITSQYEGEMTDYVYPEDIETTSTGTTTF
jgi:hypothetical protein